VSRLGRRAAVPCGVCATRIEGWGGDDRAQPCGHTVTQIRAQIVHALTRRVRWGQYAPSQE
jgi:hypothetical protein